MDLTPKAYRLFLIILGLKTLKGKMPKEADIPLKPLVIKTYLVELSLKGYILGKPGHYTIAPTKLQSPENAGKKPPSILELFNAFKEYHKAYTRRKAPSDQRALLRLRQLVRKYGALKLASVMEAYFKTLNNPKIDYPCSIFCNWADKTLKPSA